LLAQSHKDDVAHYQMAQVLNGLEIVKACYVKRTFAKHVHEEFTVGLIEHGAQRFYRSGNVHIADQHTIILVNADDVHTGEAATDYGWQYRAMYPTLSQFSSVASELFPNGHYLPFFKSAVVQDEMLARQLRQLFWHIDNHSATLMLETLTYNILLGLLTHHATNRSLPNDITGCRSKLLRAKDYLDAYPQAEVSLEALASIAGLSQYHFVRQFKKTFDITPHSYQIQARLKKAKSLLRLGVKPVDVAIDCGFHDQSHLNRHFTRVMGISPGKFFQQAILYKTH